MGSEETMFGLTAIKVSVRCVSRDVMLALPAEAVSPRKVPAPVSKIELAQHAIGHTRPRTFPEAYGRRGNYGARQQRGYLKQPHVRGLVRKGLSSLG
jgi:hypothetical protein